MTRWIKKHHVFFLIVLFIVLINAVFFFVRPDNIVNALGAKNSYLVIFFIAVIGGVSTLTGTVFFSTIFTFAAGGGNPWLLGIFGGLGLFISDSIFFLLARLGRKSVSEYWNKKIIEFENKLRRFPEWQIFLIIYFFLGFTPVPNDILMIVLAVAGYKYIKFSPYLLLGNITLAVIMANLGDKLWWI